MRNFEIRLPLIYLYTFFCLGFFVTFGKENYSEEEKIALHQFRELVKPLMTDEYMKRDYYLIRWLRARDLNLEDAMVMFEQALEWRRDNKISKILTEDLSNIAKKAPYYVEGYDKFGRPVVTWNPGRWDLRRFVVTGEGPLLRRYLDRLLEDVDQQIRHLGEKSEYNITQAVCIADIEGYTLRTHGCIQCIGMLTNFIIHYENYYPFILDALHLINVPRIFGPLYELIKPLFSKHTSQVIKLHDPDRKAWSTELLKTIPADQLRFQYGGTKV